MLSRYRGMTALHLGLNELTERGLHAVADLVSAQRDLEYLDVWGNPGMGNAGTCMLLKSLTLSPCRLRTLNLSNCGLGPSVLSSVMSLASRGHLRALSLANNALGPTAGPDLAEALRRGAAALDFSDCALGHGGVQAMAKVLQEAGRCSCALLALSWNGLGEEGIESVLAGGARHARLGGGLEELYLRGSGHVSLMAAQSARQLAAAGLPFRRLDLSRNTVSHEADRWLRKPAPPEEIVLPDHVASAADMDGENDEVYWHRLATLNFQGHQRPPLPSLSSPSLPAASRAAPAAVWLPSGAAAMALAIAPGVAVRHRRNENEAFEAFLMAGFKPKPSPHQGCHGPGERPLAQPRGRLRRGLVGIKRPTTR